MEYLRRDFPHPPSSNRGRRRTVAAVAVPVAPTAEDWNADSNSDASGPADERLGNIQPVSVTFGLSGGNCDSVNVCALLDTGSPINVVRRSLVPDTFWSERLRLPSTSGSVVRASARA